MLKRLEVNAQMREAISGTGFFSWKQKDKNIAAPGVLLVEWPDRLRLEVQDPVGGVQALLVMNGDHFWWYSSKDKEILYGKVNKLQQALGFLFSSQDLVRSFLARPDFSPWEGAQSPQGCSFCVLAQGQRLEWSDRLNQVVQWDKKFSTGLSGVVHWEDFTDRHGASFPQKIRLESFKGESLEQRIAWVWSDWQPTIGSDKKLFEIPQEERFGRKIKLLP